MFLFIRFPGGHSKPTGRPSDGLPVASFFPGRVFDWPVRSYAGPWAVSLFAGYPAGDMPQDAPGRSVSGLKPFSRISDRPRPEIALRCVSGRLAVHVKAPATGGGRWLATLRPGGGRSPTTDAGGVFLFHRRPVSAPRKEKQAKQGGVSNFQILHSLSPLKHFATIMFRKCYGLRHNFSDFSNKIGRYLRVRRGDMLRLSHVPVVPIATHSNDCARRISNVCRGLYSMLQSVAMGTMKMAQVPIATLYNDL